MRRADLGATFAAIFVALLAATPAGADGPATRTLEWDELGRWRGYRLGDLRIEDAFVSEPIPREGPGYEVLLELDLRGRDGRLRAARCTWTYAGTLWRLSLACDARTEGSDVRTTLVLEEGGRGRVRGPVTLELVWRAQNLEVLALDFARPGGARVGEWSAAGLDGARFDLNDVALGGGRRLVVFTRDAALDEALELAALVTLFRSHALEDPNLIPARAETVATPLDAYPVVSAPAATDAGLEALIAEVEAAGAGQEASLLRTHVGARRRIDRGAGAWVERHPETPRVAIGLHLGSGFAPGPDGPPGGFGGVRVEVFGGVRIRALLLGLTFGLGVAPIDGGAFAAAAGVGGVGSALFSVGGEARYTLPLFASLEGVLGLGVAARLRLTDVTGWPEGGASQFGLAVAPIVGLQVPLWRANALGTRLVLGLEGAPEVSFWRGPGVRGPAGQEASAARLDAALSGTDVGVAVRFALRFEL
jgi:hypothetical protein